MSIKLCEKCSGEARTALALGRIAKLLEAGADLLGCPSLAGHVEDVVRDELVAHGEAAERAGGAGLDGLILLEPWKRVGVLIKKH